MIVRPRNAVILSTGAGNRGTGVGGLGEPIQGPFSPKVSGLYSILQARGLAFAARGLIPLTACFRVIRGSC